jgi:hypothetical protein
MFVTLFSFFGPGTSHAEVLFFGDVDEFTGEDNSFVSVVPNSQSAEFSLGWKCFYDGLNTLLSHSYLGGNNDDEVVVLTKFDDEQPSAENFYDLAADHEITYFDMADVPKFVDSAISADRVSIRLIDPLDGETMTESFGLKGLDVELRKLSCYP